jgi:hypothetical protein
LNVLRKQNLEGRGRIKEFPTNYSFGRLGVGLEAGNLDGYERDLELFAAVTSGNLCILLIKVEIYIFLSSRREIPSPIVKV